MEMQKIFTHHDDYTNLFVTKGMVALHSCGEGLICRLSDDEVKSFANGEEVKVDQYTLQVSKDSRADPYQKGYRVAIETTDWNSDDRNILMVFFEDRDFDDFIAALV